MARDYPAFLFYPEDFATGTAEMTPTEVGIYMRCLCHQWHKLSVPDDAAKVGRITGATVDEMVASWPAVRAKFKECGDGQLKNQRLEKIRAELKRAKRVRSVSGKAGADARWGDGKQDGKSNGKRMAKPKQNDSKNMASRVGDVNVNADALATADEDAFERFWGCVPHKVGRRSAEKAYKSAVAAIKADEKHPWAPDPDTYLFNRMTAFADSPIGRGDPEFCPHPATWLNGGRYDDDPAAWKRKANKDPRGNFDAMQNYLEMDNGDE